MNPMNKILPLMQREWLQHRTGWALMLLIPLGVAALAVSFGSVQLDADDYEAAGAALPALMAMFSIAGSMAVIFAVALCSSLVTVSGLARRDHGDRSIEFWLSMPVGHAASLGTPMAVHLILVPAVALLAGLLGGYLISLILVGRMMGVGVWLGLPWATVVAASGSLALRLLAGLPLAMLWLSPLILLVVLLTAWFRRWGWVILGAGLGLGGWLLKQLFGQPWINEITLRLLAEAATALINGQHSGLNFGKGSDGIAELARLPAWALSDFGYALAELATPLLPGALLFAAGCFALLVQWRQRGASAAA